MPNIENLRVEFVTLDDGYGTTQGTAYADGELLVVKRGRGDFDVLSKISHWYTEECVAKAMRGEL